jgi:high-affinity iron transporter
MAAIFLIIFRESLEAAIVLGILAAFLARLGQARLRSALWAGGVLAIIASLGVAALFLRILGEFEGRAEQLFEGSVMLVGAGLLTSLILWIKKGDIRSALEGRAGAGLGRAGWWGLALLAFVSILREGVETVVFLGSSLRDLGWGGGLAGLAGLAGAAILGYLAFAAGKRLNAFFQVTNVLLVFFAAGLVGRAAGEFVEAGILPPLLARLWDLNLLLPEDGAVGSVLKGLFGYSATPSLVMALAYGLYFGSVAVALILHGRRRAA